MLKYILTLLVFLNLNSCITVDEFNPEDIKVSFILNDSTGTERNIFKKNEEFIAKFEVVNKSSDELHYYSSLPIISYEIIQGDSVVARSTDQMDYAAMMINGKLEKDASFVDTWIGPNTRGRKDSGDIIMLLPGDYKIEVLHSSFFTEYQLPKTKTINFEVIE
jgi:hypothetical protein